MKGNKEKAIEVNNKLRTNVDEQRNKYINLSRLSTQSSGEIVVKMKLSWSKKKKPGCVTCSKTFAMTNCFNKFIQNEHTELWWNYCGKMSEKKKKKQVDNHIYEACEWTCHECSTKDKVENEKRMHCCWGCRLIHEEGYEK